MDQILFAILQCVLVVVAGLITRYVVPWLKTKLDSEKLNVLEIWVKAAVTAAEQVFFGSSMGSEKKVYVTDAIKKYLDSKGLKITDEQLNILIEAAVKELNLSQLSDTKPQTQKLITTTKETKEENVKTTNTDDEDTDV